MALAQLLNKGPSLAELLRRQGRGKDSILAHINPREAAILKAHGGSGKRNPRTGLPEFDDADNPYDYTPPPASPVFGGGDSTPAPDVSAPSAPDTSATPSSADQAVSAGFISDPADYGSFNAAMDQAYSNLSAGGPSGMGGSAPSQPAPPIASNYVSFGDPSAAGPPSEYFGSSPDTSSSGGGQNYGSKLLDTLTKPSNLAKVIGGAGLGLLGASQSKKAAQQVQNQANQISNLGTPLTGQGNALLGATMQGALTPLSAQSYQAAQAKLAQDAQNRGGVGAQQNIAIAEQLRQSLLQNQWVAGLNLVQVGNSYVEAGIKTAIQGEQQVNQATQAFYQSLFKSIGSIS